MREVIELAEKVDGAIQELDPKARCSVTVEMPGFEDRFSPPSEFEAVLPLSQLQSVRELSLTARTTWESPEEGVVYIFLRKSSPGVTLTVNGTKQTWVDGTFARLGGSISEHSRWPRGSANVGFGLLAGVGACEVATLLLLDSHKWIALASAGGFILFAALAAAYFGMLGWMFPPLQLVPAGGLTRSEQLLGRARRAVGTLVVLVIGGVIYALADRLLR